MKLHSPQLVSLSEASLLHALMSETRRPNLLVVCRRVTVEAAARHVVSSCQPPFHMVALPGLLNLDEIKGGTLVLELLLAAGLQPPRGPLELLLVNAQHVKMVPGRKTDVRDSEWLAQLSNSACSAAASCPPRRSASSATWSATASA